MNIKKKQEIGNYNEYVKETMPKSHTFSSCIKAFLVGGLICVIGQGVSDIGKHRPDHGLCKLHGLPGAGV